MIATDELRRLLDECGVEYDGKTYEGVTFWNDDTNMAVASEDYGGKLWVSQSLTPEQAVEATLGRGTCHDTGEDKERFCCSECGSRSHIATEYRKFDEYGNKSEHFLFVGNPRFCPSCGRRVVG